MTVDEQLAQDQRVILDLTDVLTKDLENIAKSDNSLINLSGSNRKAMREAAFNKYVESVQKYADPSAL